jgi:hypothetical protein
MNIADEEEFSPDKLRANIERLYMTIVSHGTHVFASKLTVLGYRPNGIWKAYRSHSLMARDPAHCLVLFRILRRLALRHDHAPNLSDAGNVNRLPSGSRNNVSPGAHRPGQL